MPNLFRDESGDAKTDAQRNLCGRTHYVDDETLRYHKSRVVETKTTDNGLLFAIVESYAVDPENKQRAFRGVVFDVFGTVLYRPAIGEGFGTRKAAGKALWKALNEIDAIGVTLGAIKRAEHHYAQEMAQLRAELKRIGAIAKA